MEGASAQQLPKRKNDRKKRLRDGSSVGVKAVVSRKSSRRTTPGPCSLEIIPSDAPPLPLFGYLFEQHPLRKHVSTSKKSLSLDTNTREELLNTICCQNAVMGCLVKAVYRCPETGLEYDVVVRRICLSYLSDRTGVQFNSRRFAGASGKGLIDGALLWGRDYDFSWLDVGEEPDADAATSEAQAVAHTTNSCVLMFRSNKLTVVGRNSFEGSYQTAINWCRLMTQHFAEHERMKLRFYPSSFSLDNAVATAYAPTRKPLDLHLLTKTLPRTTYSPGLFPMACVRFQFYCECTEREECIVILLSDQGRVLFTRIRHVFEAVCAWKIFWERILSLFVDESKEVLSTDAQKRSEMLAFADEHLQETNVKDLKEAQKITAAPDAPDEA